VKTLTGVAASPGTAAAPAYVYRPDVYALPDTPVDDPVKALAQLAAALDVVASDLDDAARHASGAAKDILRAQATMARDPALRSSTEPEIRRGIAPARAVLAAGEHFAAQLEATGNEYLSARGPDVRHICDLAARTLADAPPRLPPHPVAPCVLVADDLTPSDTTTLDVRLIRGIATTQGSGTSHTTVIARSLGIPAVVGIRRLLDEVTDGSMLGLDGSEGLLIVHPTSAAIERLTVAGAAEEQRRSSLREASGTGPAATADGHRIEVVANVRSVEEARAALAAGAEGVGLLRTELLYIDRDRPPTEQEQLALLRELHAVLAGRRLVVRTFDIGADKPVPFLPVRPEQNPELGVRGIRLAREHPDLLATQLRAVAAAAELGPTAVMAPMVSTTEEASWFVRRCREAGVPPTVEIGVMVEIPALAMTVHRLP
jgi:phosphotransferase system enzyme I (PtsI)